MDITRQRALVCRFLERCNEYAAAKIADYEARLTAAEAEAGTVAEAHADRDAAHRLALRRKIEQWTSYREFNAHAIGEVANGDLDDWLDDAAR